MLTQSANDLSLAKPALLAASLTPISFFKYRSTSSTFNAGLIILFLDIEIPPSRFYISMSYLGVAYHKVQGCFF
jgi:hypothetical protein